MSLESATFISGLDATNPLAGDQIKQGDDHLRLLKTVLQGSFPNADKAFYFPDSVTKTGNYTIVVADMEKRLIADTTAGAFNLTLPTLAASDDGWNIWIIKTGSSVNSVTVVGTINGAANFSWGAQYRAQCFVWSGTAWYTFGGLGNPVSFVSNDPGATAAPAYELFRDSASPAASDFLGTYDFTGRSDTGVKRTYVQIGAQVADPTNTSEDAIIILRAMIAGVLTDMLQSNVSGILVPGTFNASGKASFTSTDSVAIAKGTTIQRNPSPASGDTRYNSTLNVVEYYNGTAWVTTLAPTRQYLTSGTAATYTTPAGCRLIIVREIGGGGGGGAVATNPGTAGGTTIFNSINANGGSPGAQANGAGGAGGTGGTGSANLRLNGAPGEHGSGSGVGGRGASGWEGAGGGLPGSGVAAGSAAQANSGAGGGGGANAAASNGAGGGAGEYVEIVIANPAATYLYTIGAKGNGGAAGTQAGGDGGTGLIVVDEYY